jgi:Tfp pilus assembly protein PilF/transglutaminase-like putative cysteine protease
MLRFALATTLLMTHLGSVAAGGADSAARDALVESIDTAYRCEADGSCSVTQSLRARALSAAGRAALGQVSLSTITPVEQGQFEYVRTVKPDGRVVAADLSTAVAVRQETEGGGMPGVAVTAVAVPDLEPGDVVEYRIVKSREPLAKGRFWLEHPLLSGLPVELETVSVDVPSSAAVTMRHAAGLVPEIEEVGDRRRYRWRVEQETAGGVPETELLFGLSSFRDWEEAGSWFLAAQPGVGDAPAIRAKARELAGGVPGTREQALAIYHWVARSVRWVGAPFASGGYRARPADEVLRTGWGDCKDKHGLLSALLEAVGISAQPVLVSSSGELAYPDLPAPSQFDHVVTLARVGGEELWLDSTLEVAQPGQLLPQIRGSQGLLVDPGRVALVTIPGGPAPSSIRVESSGAISAAGALDLLTTVEVGGDVELLLRLVLRHGGNQAREAVAGVWAASQVPSSQPSEVAGSEPADLEHPLTVTYRSRRDGYVGSGSPATGPIPSLLAALTADLGSAAGGEAEGAVSRPAQPTGSLAVDETVSLSFPEGSALEAPLPVETETPAGSYAAKYEVEGSQLRVRRALRCPSFSSVQEARARTARLRALVDRDIAQLVTVSAPAGQSATSAPGSGKPEELIRAAQAALGQGRAEEAASLVQTALQLSPADTAALLVLAEASLKLARWDEAEAALRRALELDPLHSEAGPLLAALLMERQRYPEAAAELSRSLQSNPFDSRSWTTLALLHRALGRRDEAVTAMESAVKIERDNPALLLGLSQLLRESGRTEEARQRLEQAMADPRIRGHALEFASMGESVLDMLAEESRLTGGIALSLPLATTPEGAADRLRAALARLVSLSDPDDGFAVVAVLHDVAEDLVRLGRADAASSQLGRAAERLRAALLLTVDGTVARELAEVDARSGDLTEAVRAWAVADRSGGVTMPAALRDHLEKSGTRGDALTEKVRAAGYELMESRSTPRGSLHPAAGCPPGTDAEHVRLRALVDETGKVVSAVAVAGADACRPAALASVRGVRLPPLTVDGTGVKTVRTVVVVFHPQGYVESQWGFGLDPLKELSGLGARVARPVE